MVEAIANGIEDKLIEGLSFKMTPGASYVVDRRSVTYHPQGSKICKPTSGTKLIPILLTGDNWLDPCTFRNMFDGRNNAAAAQKLFVLGGPHFFFRRMCLHTPASNLFLSLCVPGCFLTLSSCFLTLERASISCPVRCVLRDAFRPHPNGRVRD